MAKYSDMQRAQELLDAYNNYLLWVAKTRAQKKALYKQALTSASSTVKRWKRSTGYVQPFGTNIWLKTKVLDTTEGIAGTLKTALGARISVTPPATSSGGSPPTIVRIPKYGFAKAILTVREAGTEGAAIAAKDRTSRITGIPYKAYLTDSVSCVFGKLTTATEEAFETAATEIRKNTGMAIELAKDGSRLSIIPQTSSISNDRKKSTPQRKRRNAWALFAG